MDERNKGGTLREGEREREREHAAERAVTRRPEAPDFSNHGALLEARAFRRIRVTNVAPRKRTMRDVPGNIQMKLRYRRKYSEIALLTATRSA